MFKKMFVLISLLVAATMVLAACGPAATPPPEAEVPAVEAPAFRVGYVTDTGGIDDKSFNTNQWEGIQKAVSELGVEAQFIQSDEASQYTPNLTEFASQGYDLVIASGFWLGPDLAKVAAQYPDLKFSIVDYNYPQAFDVPEGVVGNKECIPNVMGQVFKTDQAAYLAGYLASGMAVLRDPADPKIGYFGGMKIPTVTIFGVGWQKGMEAYNAAHGTTVKLIGWDNATGEGQFTGDFVDLTKGAALAASQADEGVDILFGVGGMVGSPAFQVAEDRDLLVVWVDVDGARLFPEDTSVLLTSVMKRMDNSQFDLIKATMAGNFQGCTDYIGDMANGGIELGSYNELDSQIPADLKAEVDALKANIISGELTDVGCLSYPSYCPSGIYPAE